MQNMKALRLWLGIAGALLVTPLGGATAFAQDTIQAHWQECADALGISSLPQYSCYDGVPAGMNTRVNRMGRVEGTPEHIEAVYLCRDISEGTVGLHSMIVHNRRNGKTCFFESLAGTAGVRVPVDGPSPSDPNANTYWDRPSRLLTGDSVCGECHTSGPFITGVSELNGNKRFDMAEIMASFGLINNVPYSRLKDPTQYKYEAVGSTIDYWNTRFLSTPSTHPLATDAACSGCHTIGEGPIMANFLADVGGWMPPSGNSPFRWVNRDSPSYSGDHEPLSSINRSFPGIACDNPSGITARLIQPGMNEHGLMKANPLGDVFRKFNAQDGLECRKADQPDGECHDWRVSFLCNGRWTRWKDRDDPSGTGDYERRSDFPDVCAQPEAMRVIAPGSSNEQFWAPPDRLRSFSAREGLRCYNSDQVDGTCFNYSVRFDCGN